jgi:beta-lactamase superfamily II metal-dependent hydrolase
LPPSADQIELTLFGPGYGECAVVHLGNNHWVIIDSCIDSETKQPTALAYFQTIGVEPKDAVRLIITTHWHDDHIRGLSRLLAKCQKARFCCSSALTHKEFWATVLDYEAQPAMATTSGLREIFEVYQELQTRPVPARTPIYALPNRPVFSLRAEESGHGAECRVWTLSPSDRQYQKFLDELTLLMPCVKETKRRATPQEPNHVSVVTWISIGGIALLLGADLEETGNEDTGWAVIVASTERPQGKASIFKIPHHGSETAHNDMVWQQMLMPRPYAILSPYNRGHKKLPSPADIQRITAYTEHAYATSSLRTPHARKDRPPVIIKTIRETVGQIRAAQPRTGWIRLRNGGQQQPDRWCVELSTSAFRLGNANNPG